MKILRTRLYDWIINPIVLYSSSLGADFTADTTAFKADTILKTCDSITI